MPGFTLAAAASIIAGLSLGAAATVAVTLVVDGSVHPGMPPAQTGPVPLVSTVVQYGDRCPGELCPPTTGRSLQP